MSQEELKNTLGEYTAPVGLYSKTKDMKFLGTLTCHTEKLVAGSWEQIVLDYEIGASGMADGAWFKATFKFYSDWALFQTTDPKGANYVSAEYQAGPCVEGQSSATVQSLKVRFDQKGHERPFQKAVIVDTVDGYLKPGDHIIIRLGDKRAGGPGTRIQTFVEEGFKFRCYVDPLGTSRFSAVPGDIMIDIVPGFPKQLQLVASRMVKIGENLPTRIRVEDEWGNTCWDLGGELKVKAQHDGSEVYNKTVALPDKGWAVALLDDMPTDQAGELKISAELDGHPAVDRKDFYVTVTDELKVPRVLYGDLHVHSDDTVGTNSTVYNLTYGRDVAGLDVLGYTANDFQITKDNWSKAVETIEGLNKDGEFVCYPGTEWCGNSCAGGDHNVVFLHGKEPEFPFGKDGQMARSFEWNEDMTSDTIEPGAWPLEELWATYIHDPEGHLLMPHVGGRRCIMDWYHPKLDRLVEIGSAWGQFPWLYQESMARGYKLGASANGDEHRGRCGGGVPGTAVFGVKGGVTGIISDSLDRKAVGVALRARHTWATTGERTVALASCGENIQGDEFNHNGRALVEYRFLGDAGWDEIVAYDHEGCIWKRNLIEENGFSDQRIRIRWGGARIKDRYRWAAWRGTITVTNGVINSFEATNFEHEEENCWRASPIQIGFKSDTYGDNDSVEIDVSNLDKCVIRVQGTIDGYVKVGDPLKGNPFVHCPEFDWEITGKELIENGALRKELGGQDVFLAVERLTDAELSRDISGTLDVDALNGPHGFRPIYFSGRQRDGAMAWTSSLFIHFVEEYVEE